MRLLIRPFMATATHQPSFFDSDAFGNFMEAAKRRYPFSAKHGQIRGDGKFALVLRCSTPWRVKCYRTVEECREVFDRLQWSSCGAVRCTHDHRCEVL
jgi:hypothetical protein